MFDLSLFGLVAGLFFTIFSPRVFSLTKTFGGDWFASHFADDCAFRLGFRRVVALVVLWDDPRQGTFQDTTGPRSKPIDSIFNRAQA